MIHYLYYPHVSHNLSIHKFEVMNDYVTIIQYCKEPNENMEVCSTFTLNIDNARKKYKKDLKNTYRKPNNTQVKVIESFISSYNKQSAYPQPTNTKTLKI